MSSIWQLKKGPTKQIGCLFRGSSSCLSSNSFTPEKKNANTNDKLTQDQGPTIELVQHNHFLWILCLLKVVCRKTITHCHEPQS